MPSFGKIQQIYGTFLDRALRWMRGNGYSVNAAVSISATKMGPDEVVVTTKDPLHFQDWPYRKKSSEKIEILASIRETVSLQQGTCNSATVCVHYFEIDGNRAIATESLRYDCLLPPQTKKQHPVCHVHCSNEKPNRLPPSFRWEVDDHPIEKRCQTVRIPSAFVNLPGLLAILAADHMTEAHWEDFVKVCLRNIDEFPPIAHHDIVDSAIREGRLSAWKWYER